MTVLLQNSIYMKRARQTIRDRKAELNIFKAGVRAPKSPATRTLLLKVSRMNCLALRANSAEQARCLNAYYWASRILLKFLLAENLHGAVIGVFPGYSVSTIESMSTTEWSLSRLIGRFLAVDITLASDCFSKKQKAINDTARETSDVGDGLYGQALINCP